MTEIETSAAAATHASDYKPDYLTLTADIISAYVTKNSVPASELPTLIASIHASLGSTGAPATPVEELKKEPAVSIKKSVTDDHIVCLEDGKKFKTLKRHLLTAYNMTPQQYRTKWGLPSDYPMTAPNYSATRSSLAKAAGLGAARQDSASKASKTSKARAKKVA